MLFSVPTGYLRAQMKATDFVSKTQSQMDICPCNFYRTQLSIGWYELSCYERRSNFAARRSPVVTETLDVVDREI